MRTICSFFFTSLSADSMVPSARLTHLIQVPNPFCCLGYSFKATCFLSSFSKAGCDQARQKGWLYTGPALEGYTSNRKQRLLGDQKSKTLKISGVMWTVGAWALGQQTFIQILPGPFTVMVLDKQLNTTVHRGNVMPGLPGLPGGFSESAMPHALEQCLAYNRCPQMYKQHSAAVKNTGSRRRTVFNS